MPRPAEMGEYELLGLIGRGGMAEVYLASHRQRGERCALKVLHLPGVRLQERLLREGRLQARIDHDNVLPVLEETVLFGRPALVLPYVEGPSLDRFLAESTLTLPQALGLFQGVLAGVEAIHGAGLVHRDLKPGNVLLDPARGSGVPRVADFGLVKALAEEAKLTRTGVGLGTPLYAAPEQLRDAGSVDARSDVYALGCLLIELLAGRSDPEEPFEARLPRLAPPWVHLAQKMLASDPMARPPDAFAVRRLLPENLPTATLSGELCRSLAPAVLPIPAVQPGPPKVFGGTLSPASVGSTLPLPPAPSHVLPAGRDEFLGRVEELAALKEGVGTGTRLVTVLGPGGVGKTRLVLHWVRENLTCWPGGAWFVDLCEAHSIDGIMTAVARTLAVRLDPVDPLRQLGHALAGRGACLFIFDNFEQVAEHAEETLGKWLDRADKAQFIVTSRAVLGIAGESTLVLPPLTQRDAEALFLRRAVAARRSFWPTRDEQVAISTLMELLDRLPLAIELAAARVRTLSPLQIQERLQQRLLVLGAPGAGRGRHATLRAALDWSYQLLRPDEQQALCQLSVFEGGFSLDSAHAVLRMPDATETWSALQSLVDQSLVTTSKDRMDLLVSVKAYASEKLGTERQAVEKRHGEYFARLGRPEVRLALFRGGELPLPIELDNLVAAYRRAIARGEGGMAAALLKGIWAILDLQGPMAMAITLATELMGMASIGPAERGQALAVAGESLQRRGLYAKAREHFEEALALARPSDPQLELWMLTSLGRLSHVTGSRDLAQKWLEEAVALARRLGARREEGIALGNLGLVNGRRDLAKAHEYYVAARSLAQEQGDLRMEAQILVNIANLRGLQERHEESVSLFESALALGRKIGDGQIEERCLLNLAAQHHQRGHRSEVIALLERALLIARKLGHRDSEGNACLGLGGAYLEEGRSDEAVALFEVSVAASREAGDRSSEGFALARLARAYHSQGRPDEASRCGERAMAVIRSLASDHWSAKALVQVALLLSVLGDKARATLLLDEAMATMRESREQVGLMDLEANDFGFVLAARAELAISARATALARRLLDEAGALNFVQGSPVLATVVRLQAELAALATPEA